MTLTQTQIDELREKAEKAEPEAWWRDDKDIWSLDEEFNEPHRYICRVWPRYWSNSAHHLTEEEASIKADYIVAANPKTILALLDELERQKKAVEVLRKGLELYKELLNKEWLCRDTSKDHLPDWHLKQLEFVPKFKEAFESLKKANEILGE